MGAPRRNSNAPLPRHSCAALLFLAVLQFHDITSTGGVHAELTNGWPCLAGQYPDDEGNCLSSCDMETDCNLQGRCGCDGQCECYEGWLGEACNVSASEFGLPCLAGQYPDDEGNCLSSCDIETASKLQGV